MFGTGRMILLMAAVGFPLSGCGGSVSDKAGGKTAPPKARVALTLADGSSDPVEVEGFVKEVSRLSGGTITIVVRAKWRWGQVAYENGLIGDVQAGRADLGVAGARAWDSVGVPTFQALNAPLLIDSYALQNRVLSSPLIPEMLNGVSRIGLVGLGVLPGPLRYPLGIVRPLLAPSDYAGLTIGVQQSRVSSATMRALGANPVWLPAGSLTKGLGGIDQGITTIQGLEYDRVGRYLTSNVVLWPRPLVVFANRVALAKLTARERGILAQAATDDVAAQTSFEQATERENLGDLCRRSRLRFLTASPGDLAALHRAVGPVYATLEQDPRVRADINQILALRNGMPAEPALRCGSSTTAVALRSPVDGVWQMNTTYADNRGDPTPTPENYGHWIFVFEDGHFADTQQYLNACTWAYGTFTVKGDKMAWTFTDGGGIEPNGAGNKPGEFFQFRWSRYRDTLTVTGVPGAISPQNFYLKPWRRVSTVPSARYLDRRCPPPANALPS